MKKVIISGSGQDAVQLMEWIRESNSYDLQGVVSQSPTDPAAKFAKLHHIHTESNLDALLNPSVELLVEFPDCLIERTKLPRNLKNSLTIIPADLMRLISVKIQDLTSMFQQLQAQSDQQRLILDLTYDGTIAIDKDEIITVFNPSAEKIFGLKRNNAMGKPITQLIPTSQLPRVLKSGRPEINQEQALVNGQNILTTRLPMRDPHGRLVGAFAVFRDITDIVNMADEVTNLKSIQTMLEAIIQSSEEAISVVDEHGRGLMINPAYTRLTGLSEKDVIGKPATTDISEGESIHMQVLKTRKPVRGARLKVGQGKRDVLVNVAPIIVEGKLKGSVAVIHDLSEITNLTKELHRARQIIRTLEAKYTFEDIIGESEEMEVVKQQAQLAASTPITILLRGESGTGKELFAHAIHNASSRKYNKFVRVNCAAIPESLLESEMFGYEEGAFSGAKRGGKRGYFEEANGGSIFLDEIGELSIPMQAKLLRILQENEMVRVGGTKPIPIDVRVITATHVNLEKRIVEGTFRKDLYYRLNRMPIFIPPLRQRRSDIPELCWHLIHKINQEYGRNVTGISHAAIERLKSHSWPGNVRELENILGRAIINMKKSETTIQLSHIPPLQYEEKQIQKETMSVQLEKKLADQVNDFEKELIRQTLIDNNMNKTQTAKQLGISVRNLYYKMEKYDLEKTGMQ